MQLWSQKDPSIADLKMPFSSLMVKDYGCLACCMAMLGQRNLADVLKIPGGFVNGGLLVTDRVAKALGMFFVGATTIPPKGKGWCVGRTDKYRSNGFPTHFLLVNMDTNQMVDPLIHPARVQDLSYNINQYRVFSGVKFNTTPVPPQFEFPNSESIPDWAKEVEVRAKKAGIKTPLTDSFGDMPIYQALLLIEKYFSVQD